MEAGEQVVVEGEEIPYRQLPVRVRREPDRAHRAAYEAARLRVVEEELNPLHLQALEAIHGVADELLGTTYDGYCERLSGVSFDALEEKTERVLAETRDAHEELLRHHARRALPGVGPRELETHDLARLLHGAEFEAGFPGDELVPRAARSVEAMGLDLTAEGRIELDLEERPTKSPRAFCSAIRVPDEVKLVIQPHGGHDDYAAFLHELGHALHFAHVDPAHPVEFRRLGDHGVTEGYAMTFDHLLHLPAFLSWAIGDGDRPTDAFPRFAAFRDLVMIRRYAAKFAYERSLHREGAGPARAAEYAERLTAATGARVPEALYLEDVDPHFYCVRYLRAWMLAGALHRELRDRFDEDWFRNPRTGAFLVDLWSIGQALPAEALAARNLGVEPLTFEPLLEMLGERF